MQWLPLGHQNAHGTAEQAKAVAAAYERVREQEGHDHPHVAELRRSIQQRALELSPFLQKHGGTPGYSEMESARTVLSRCVYSTAREPHTEQSAASLFRSPLRGEVRSAAEAARVSEPPRYTTVRLALSEEDYNEVLFRKGELHRSH